MTKVWTMRRVVVLFRSRQRHLLAIAFIVIVTSGLIVVNPLLSCYVGAMTAAAIIASVLGVAQTYVTNVLGQRVMRDLRNRRYAHLRRMSLRFFTETESGEIQSRLTNDVGGIQTIVTDTASSIMSNVVIIVSTLTAMLILSWQLTVFSCALAPVFIWLTIRIGKIRRTTASCTQQTMADLATLSPATLSVSGVLLTKSFGRQPEGIARFRERNAQLADLRVRQQMIGRGSFAALGTFFLAAPALVYPAAGVFGTHGITAGTLAAYSSVQSRLFYPLGALLSVSTQGQSSRALFERIFSSLDLPHEIVDAPGATDLPPAQMRGAVSLRNVSFRCPAPNGATSRLKDVDAPGVALAGWPTGSFPRKITDPRHLRCSGASEMIISCWWWGFFCSGPGRGPPELGEGARCAVPAGSSIKRVECAARWESRTPQ